jgi:hypothetical protein
MFFFTVVVSGVALSFYDGFIAHRQKQQLKIVAYNNQRTN